ncbi:MAG: discoidin domain-containing protein [Bacteroidales bacterium]|nr:discoidin domain-containing protein [Bacteroidales bacterium]
MKRDFGVTFDDIKLEIAGAETKGNDGLPAEQNADYAIGKAFDGNLDNEYSSQWGGNTKMPVTLDFTLKEPDQVDYIVFYPKGPLTSNVNGYWNEFEVHTSTDGTTFTKANDYQFTLTQDDKAQTYIIKAPQKIELPEPAENVKTVRVVVKSSYHSNATNLPQLVSCAEVEIYKKDPVGFNPPQIDNSFQVVSRNGYVYVTGNNFPAQLFTMDGRSIHIKDRQSPGIYIVKADGYAKKIRVE